ncbi:division/cell wall cluster transcriptional repressor MraZ [Oscillatoria amoena NRMC-F 0135]|nr:division/cell wall cluster transcriptional repressor MraZ [Oscillatoria amoena NRMC-F 0135]
MPQFIGEFECKMDGKGRVMLPASLRKQIPDEAGDKLVVNRGFDKCLTLYTKADWQKETDKLKGLNSFNKKDRLFIRLFNNGATEVQIDTASRILIPKKLQEYAEMENDLVLYAYENKIEIWSAKNYEEMFNMSADDFSELAEEVMSRKDKGGDGDE